jgi:hypothetical protein
MRMKKLLPVVFVFAATLLADAPRGTVPRASAEKYAAHAEQNGNSLGARLLSVKEAHKEFATDVDQCCMVVEVAIYPQKDGMLEISLSDFVLRVVGQDIGSKPTSAAVVAGRLQRKAEPESTGKDVRISPSVGIGYETGGIDPVTGQRRPGGVVRSTGVGVGVGGQQPPKPGSTDADRRTMELELKEKGLPEGNISASIAGYIYFSSPQKRNTRYQLEYMLNGSKVVLPL